MSRSIGALLAVTMACAVVFLVATSTIWGKDDTDPKDGRSGLRLTIDAGTGCHWLGGLFSDLVPRLDANGQHVCRVEDRRK